MKTAHVFISGFVQGVGFRHFIRKQALLLGLTGWVRNTEDNRVEALLQDLSSNAAEAKEKIDKMLTLCKKGPEIAEVKDVTVEWITEENNFNGFEITA